MHTNLVRQVVSFIATIAVAFAGFAITASSAEAAPAPAKITPAIGTSLTAARSSEPVVLKRVSSASKSWLFFRGVFKNRSGFNCTAHFKRLGTKQAWSKAVPPYERVRKRIKIKQGEVYNLQLSFTCKRYFRGGGVLARYRVFVPE